MENNSSNTKLMAIPREVAKSTDRTNLSIQEITSLGEVFSKSGFFSDATVAAKAIVKILAGQELGIPPFTAMKELNIFNGKLAFSANLVAMIIKKSNRYDYRIRELTNEKAILDFYEGTTHLGESIFTMQDAKLAELDKKDVWKKYPKNLLFARALTNGAKWYCPHIFGGSVYTSEEIESFDDFTNYQTKEETKEQKELREKWLSSLVKMQNKINELTQTYYSQEDYNGYSLDKLKQVVENKAHNLREVLVLEYNKLLEQFYQLPENLQTITQGHRIEEKDSLQEINRNYESLKLYLDEIEKNKAINETETIEPEIV